MRIIASELKTDLPEEIRPIVLRVIHATADFSFAEGMRFSPGVISEARRFLCDGATIVTDTNMALAGISKSACTRVGAVGRCFMADDDVIREAVNRNETRAWISAERAVGIQGPKLLVCGNAPTFLLSLLNRREKLKDAVIIGVPVGFVNVVESKERLWQSGLPCIAAMGRRGGSTVAAAIVNALLYGIEGVRS